MSIDPILIAATKSQVLEELDGGGGGSGIPFFNLAEMGLPVLQIGSHVSKNVDIDEIVNAIKGGILTISFGVTIDGFSMPVVSTMTGIYLDAMGVYQANSLLNFDGNKIYLSLIAKHGLLELYSFIL